MNVAPIVIQKAFVHVTRLGRDLLVMSHPDHPEAGLQVPAGTMQDGETPGQAAARELMEETGLVGLGAMTFLGEQTYDMRPLGKHELHRRFFHHAVHGGGGPDRWSHVEARAGPTPIRLDLI